MQYGHWNVNSYSSKLFFTKGLATNQVPLGPAALSQVSSALQSALDSDPNTLLQQFSSKDSAVDQQEQCQQKRIKQFGSFDILDAEDLREAGTAGWMCVQSCVHELIMVTRVRISSCHGQFLRRTLYPALISLHLYFWI